MSERFIREEGSGQMKQLHEQVLGGASKEAGAASAKGKGIGAEVREGGVQGFAGGKGATGGFGAEERLQSNL